MNNRKPLLRIVSWYVLTFPAISSTLLLYCGSDWTWWAVIVSQFILFFPLICFVFQFVCFYEDCMVVIRPLNLFHMKRSYCISKSTILRMYSMVALLLLCLLMICWCIYRIKGNPSESPCRHPQRSKKSLRN